VPGNDYNAAFVHVGVRHFCWKCLHLMMDCSTRSVGFWGIREVSSTGWLLKYTPCTFYHLLLHTILFCAQLQLMAITGAKKGGMCCCLLDWAWIPVIAGFGMQGQSRNAEHILSEASMLPGKRGTGSAGCSLLHNFHNCTLSTGLPQSVLGRRMSSPLSQVLSRRWIKTWFRPATAAVWCQQCDSLFSMFSSSTFSRRGTYCVLWMLLPDCCLVVPATGPHAGIFRHSQGRCKQHLLPLLLPML